MTERDQLAAPGALLRLVAAPILVTLALFSGWGQAYLGIADA